jgi:phosphoribosylamine-glycine ligase
MFNVEQAKKEGYSDKEIASFLAKSERFNINGAMKQGYSYAEIIEFLSPLFSKKTSRYSLTWKRPDTVRTVGVIDTNLGLDHALALKDAFDVKYYLASGGAYPYLKDEISGDGFKGIKKVQHMADATACDFIVFLDCYFGKDADVLRKEGRDVYGPSFYWTEIENDRRIGWKRLQEMGVGVPEGKIVKGIEALLKYIRERQDGKRVFFIKTSKYRGSKETGGSVLNWIEALVSVTQGAFGPYLTDMEFLVQDKCPGVELGGDFYFNGKNFIRPYLLTIEEKGSGSVGCWMDSSPIDDLLLNKVLPSLKRTDYRGNISFEFFYDEKGKIYVFDPCCRNAFPCSAIQAHRIKNYPEVIYAVASSQNIRVEVNNKYEAQIGLYTDDKDSWRPLRFPNNMKQDIGFRRAVIRNGEVYYCPGDFVVCTAMGSGQMIEEAIDKATEVVEKIECSNSSYPGGFRGDVLKKIKTLNAWKTDLKF